MFVDPKHNTKRLYVTFNSLRNYLDYVPGGVKMACSSIALAFAIWIVVQFGSQTMLAAMEGTAFIKMPVNTIQSYLDTYSDWSSTSDRWKRAVRRMPNVDHREMASTINFAQSVVNKMDRHETNIAGANIVVKKGTPMHGQLIDSLPSPEALQHGKDALIAVKASQYLASKHCVRLGIDDNSCAVQVSQLPLGPTTLGTKCSIHYRQTVFCSEFTKYRSSDGSCNHRTHPAWGQASTAYKRLVSAKYEDGFQKPRGSTLGQEFPSPRLISTSFSRNGDIPDMSKTMAVALWGQFVYHDLAHTAVSKMYHTNDPIICCSKDGNHLSPRYVHASCYPITIPKGDPFYGKLYHTCMSYVRSLVAFRPDCSLGPAEQLNQATHFLDGSTIYGNSRATERSLRNSNGRLKVDIQGGREFLPYQSDDLPHCHPSPNKTCYKSGDVRVNSVPHAAILHTIWVREHNRIADKLASLNPNWSDDQLFNEAKKIVIAQIQHITYNEWLPVVLSKKYMRKEGLHLQEGHSYLYSEEVNPSISNSFATAAMRFINSLIEGTVGLYDENRISKLNILLENHFNHPHVMQDNNQLDALVRGLATQSSQKMNMEHSEAITRYLYSYSGSYGMDGFSLDIQRGRDHGLASYNDYRAYCGLPRAKTFNDLVDTIPISHISVLKNLYQKVDNVDLLVGGLAELAVGDAIVGPIFRCIIGEQFIRTRVGDRYFYDNADQPGQFTKGQLAEIKKTSLARVLCDNSHNVLTMQPYVFYKPQTPINDLYSCSESNPIHRMNLDLWQEQLPPSILD